jgi:hypothetical protein
MAVRQARILAQSCTIRFHRFGLPAHVVEKDGEIVEQHRLVSVRLHRFAVDALGPVEAPHFVEQAPEVDACLQKAGVSGNGPLVRLERRLRVLFLQGDRASNQSSALAGGSALCDSRLTQST